MHLNTALALAVSVLFVGTSAVPTANKLSPPFYDSIADRRFHRLEHKYTKAINKVLKKNGLDANCTADNVQRRKQWGDISTTDRSRYIDAVMCLYNTPSKADRSVVPGARNRLDDYVASHIVSAPFVHFNGHFQAWHRHFLHLYNEDLRNTCGYDGPVPYWDWTLDNEDPRKSPVFDGGEFSMGGNGKPFDHGVTFAHAFGKVLAAPAGTGGGCLEEGHPFSDIIVNLGIDPQITNSTKITVPKLRWKDQTKINPSGLPKTLLTSHIATIDDPESPPPNKPTTQILDPYNDNIMRMLNPNPRCLRRDINLQWSQLIDTRTILRQLDCPDFECFSRRGDGWEAGVSNYTNSVNQVHAAGHFTIGGLNNNVYASAGDPMFFLHHAQIDRVWAIWQGQDLRGREEEIGGTYMPFDDPETSEVQADDMLEFPFVGEPVRLGDIGSAIQGRYCYMYE